MTKAKLLECIKSMDWRSVSRCLEAQPDLAIIKDKKGRNLLHLCCSVDVVKTGISPDQTIRMADVLIHHKLDINKPSFEEGKFQATPLWHAIAFGKNRNLATHLLKLRANPEHCLFAAAYQDAADIIDLLITYGARVDPVADVTPFLAAIRWNKFKAAKKLLEKGADVDHQDAKGMTALHYVLQKNIGKETVRMLARAGANANLKNHNHQSALDLMRKKRDKGYLKMFKNS